MVAGRLQHIKCTLGDYTDHVRACGDPLCLCWNNSDHETGHETSSNCPCCGFDMQHMARIVPLHLWSFRHAHVGRQVVVGWGHRDIVLSREGASAIVVHT